MTRFLQIVILALAALPVMAQDAPDQPATSNAPAKPIKPSPTKPLHPLPMGRITGTVFCADTHRPARGAMVALAGKPEKQGSRDGGTSRVAMDGTYSFEHVPPGEYAVIAIMPGYLTPFNSFVLNTDSSDSDPEAEMWKRESEHGSVTIHAGELAKFDIELQRGAIVSGRVLYSDGAPAAQIIVQVENIQADKAKSDPNNSGFNLDSLLRSAMRQPLATDDMGRFRISGVGSGTYRIVAIQLSKDNVGDLSDDGSSDHLAVRVYSTDTLHKKAAKTYELRAGEETAGVDITIPIEAFHAVRGRISSVDGRSINMADVTLTDPDDDAFSMSTKLQRDGSFNFPAVPSGTYTLTGKNIRIGELPAEAPEEFAQTYPLAPKTAFGDSTQSIVVADTDLADVSISVTEVPMPKADSKPQR